jgi:TatD DNase family protein
MIAPFRAAGAYFSFSGSITRPANRRGHEAAQAAPLDRLLIETDAPDMTPLLPSPASLPESGQGPKINEPANLGHVLKKLAELRRISESELAEQLWKNALALWGNAFPHT